MKRRDAPSYQTLYDLWRKASERTGYGLYGTVLHADKGEAALVLADGLAEHGYKRLGQKLSDLTRRFEKLWRLTARERATEGSKERSRLMSEWNKIHPLIGRAIEEIRAGKGKTVWVTKPTSGKPKLAVVRYCHAISPDPTDVEGPFPVTEEDLSDLESIRAWYKKYVSKVGFGRVTGWRKEKGKIVLFPSGRFSVHSIVIEPGRIKKRIPAQEVAEMVRLLADRGWSSPGMYARRFYREGVRRSGLTSLLTVPIGHTDPRYVRPEDRGEQTMNRFNELINYWRRRST